MFRASTLLLLAAGRHITGPLRIDHLLPFQ